MKRPLVGVVDRVRGGRRHSDGGRAHDTAPKPHPEDNLFSERILRRDASAPGSGSGLNGRTRGARVIFIASAPPLSSDMLVSLAW